MAAPSVVSITLILGACTHILPSGSHRQGVQRDVCSDFGGWLECLSFNRTVQARVCLKCCMGRPVSMPLTFRQCMERLILFDF